MIIWINGAFGAGKTQTAFELHRRIPNSYVYDPENAGYFIRKNSPKKIHIDDFQDHSMWREFNYTMLSYLNGNYDGVILVPMTLVNLQYFNEIVGNLRSDGVEVKHFALSASRETILKRLKGRGDGENSWAAQRAERCIKGLTHEIFAESVDTETKTIEEVAEEIALKSNVSLLPRSNSKLQKLWNRVKTQLQHVRF